MSKQSTMKMKVSTAMHLHTEHNCSHLILVKIINNPPNLSEFSISYESDNENLSVKKNNEIKNGQQSVYTVEYSRNASTV